ncbi:MAG: serine protease, partial [Microbacteriaceae bacterium]|nr:serine protease [Microbacteriaceae bacterium]
GPGESKTYTVTLSRTTAPLDTFTSGSLTWTSGDTTVRSPIAVQPAAILAPEFVEGTGVTGSLDVTVTPGTTGDIALSSTGLSAGEFLADPTNTAPGHSGGGVTNDEVSYEVEVPTGTEFTRFELDAMNDTADVDLVVYQLNAAGEPVAGWASESGGGDEVIDLVAPEAGTYAIIAVVIADNVWDLTVTSVVTGGSALELTPPVLPGVLGVPTTYTASWSGLTPNSSYLGIVGYGSSGASTLVQVTTGEAETPEPVTPVNTAPPVISGTAQVGSSLTATTGEWDTPGLEFAFQWQVDGADIAGATGASYTVTSAEQGAALTVIVTATGAGLTTATATSAAVTILFTSQTKVTLDHLLLFSWQRATVTVKIASASPAPATGTVTITVKGRDYSAPVTGSTNGRVTFTMPKLPAGIYSVRASYSGDAAVAGSTSSSAFMWVIV